MIPPMIRTSPSAGRCDALSPNGEGMDSTRCGAPCALVIGTPVEGRRPIEAARCDEHGGEAAAREAVRSAWSMRAPASVGDDDAVLDAGCLGLTSEHAIVVLREEPPHWLAFLGVGSHVRPVVNPNGKPRRRRAGTTQEERAKPSCVFLDEASALAAARAAWRVELERRIEEIRVARGGTLDWGARIEPAAEPIVVRPRVGESAYAALERAQTEQHQAKEERWVAK